MHPLRRNQLRIAKRKQRAKEREAGLCHYQIRLPAELAEKLKTGLGDELFTLRLYRFIDKEMINVSQFPNLKMLCWNRRTQTLSRKEAFDLYEGNWRHIDQNNMTDCEHKLIDDLCVEFGHGVLNV